MYGNERVQSVQNCCFSVLIMQICDIPVSVVVVVASRKYWYIGLVGWFEWNFPVKLRLSTTQIDKLLLLSQSAVMRLTRGSYYLKLMGSILTRTCDGRRGARLSLSPFQARLLLSFTLRFGNNKKSQSSKVSTCSRSHLFLPSLNHSITWR